MAFSLISSMVLGLLNLLQIFRQLHRIELLGLLIGYSSCSTWYIRAFGRVWYTGLVDKLNSYRISGQIFGLFSSFLSNRQLRMVLDGESSQEYTVNAGVPQESILGPTLFL